MNGDTTVTVQANDTIDLHTTSTQYRCSCSIEVEFKVTMSYLDLDLKLVLVLLLAEIDRRTVSSMTLTSMAPRLSRNPKSLTFYDDYDRPCYSNLSSFGHDALFEDVFDAL